jgi:hypothetical protein
MNPFCTHAHTDALYLSALCHQGTGVRVDYAPDRPDLPCGAILRLRCRRCTAFVTQIALIERVTLTPTCRHGRALDVRYSQGQVTVMCRRCQAPQGTAAVAPYIQEPA